MLLQAGARAQPRIQLALITRHWWLTLASASLMGICTTPTQRSTRLFARCSDAPQGLTLTLTPTLIPTLIPTLTLTLIPILTPRDREAFFFATVGCRRRLERKWAETPLARVFLVPDEWRTLKQRAQGIFMREAIAEKKLTLWEAFTTFDADDNGLISPAEFFGTLRWLAAPDLTPEHVVDFIEAADTTRDGMVTQKEFIALIRGDKEEEEEEDEDEEGEVRKQLPPKVEPWGADELREVMMMR